jgi:hypothetical protein
MSTKTGAYGANSKVRSHSALSSVPHADSSPRPPSPIPTSEYVNPLSSPRHSPVVKEDRAYRLVMLHRKHGTRKSTRRRRGQRCVSIASATPRLCSLGREPSEALLSLEQISTHRTKNSPRMPKRPKKRSSRVRHCSLPLSHRRHPAALSFCSCPHSCHLLLHLPARRQAPPSEEGRPPESDRDDEGARLAARTRQEPEQDDRDRRQCRQRSETTGFLLRRVQTDVQGQCEVPRPH